jgi:hypothetical protein
VIAWATGLAVLLALTAPHTAAAATCTKEISGPNDPGYAEATDVFRVHLPPPIR